MVRQAVIIVGGKGTRLGNITRFTPKPLLEVSGQPFVTYLIEQCKRHGISEVILLTGPYENKFKDKLGDGSDFGVKIVYISEPEPAGTGGALVYAQEVLDSSFLFFNGDTYFDINILDLPLYAKNKNNCIALREVINVDRYGAVKLDEDNYITSFREKNVEGKGLINGGIYYLQKRVLNDIKQIPCSLENDVFPALLAKGELKGMSSNGRFIDIGVPEDLKIAREHLHSWRAKPALFLDRDGVINKDLGYVHKPDDFIWIDGAKETILEANRLGYFVFVITNQAGIGRGYYTERDVDKLHIWINEKLSEIGAHIDGFYYCPHHPEHGIGSYRQDCNSRKPKTGMIEKAFSEWPIEVGRSILIGDKESDIIAGEKSNIISLLFTGENLKSLFRAAMERQN